MKKSISLLAICLVLFFSCKKSEKQEAILPNNAQTTFSVNPMATKIHWTAYKTTAKTPVKGIFTSIKFTNKIKSDTKQGAFANLTFDIPVTSLFSKDESRDTKIQQLFFGMMKDTQLISGRFYDIMGNEKEGTMVLHLKMNNVTIPVPMTYQIDGNNVTLNGTIKDLMAWKTNKAFKTFHNACKLLHKGEDGISRTWEDVSISATTILNN